MAPGTGAGEAHILGVRQGRQQRFACGAEVPEGLEGLGAQGSSRAQCRVGKEQVNEREASSHGGRRVLGFRSGRWGGSVTEGVMAVPPGGGEVAGTKGLSRGRLRCVVTQGCEGIPPSSVTSLETTAGEWEESRPESELKAKRLLGWRADAMRGDRV